MKFQAPRGTEDVLPDSSPHWRWLESKFHEVCSLYGYGEIRTPTFEDTALFHRLGEGSDVVSKETYTFTDRGERSITLKPEGTAPAIRAYVEHSLGAIGQITKLYYITPAFRYDRPQKGRFREHHQVGVELIGSAQSDADAEVIELTVRFYRALGLDALQVSLNSLGESECRSRYRDALLEFARPALKDMPAEFRERCEKNPMRILDSKDEALQKAMVDAPVIGDYLEPESKAHFEALQERLAALEVSFALAPRLVRGLDYYTKTVFEVLSSSLGAQSSLCGGGRYDGLIKECGGADTPAVGVAMGIERAMLVLSELGKLPAISTAPNAFAVCLTEDRNAFTKIVQSLRDKGISIETDLEFRSAKSQFRQADKSGAMFAVVIGDDELASGIATVKELQGGNEEKVPLPELAKKLA